MTQSFDEWVDKNSLNFHPKDYYLYKDIFEAGAQSKQAEIDELREQVTGQARTAQNQQAEIYRLQSAIKKALERANHEHIGYGMLYAQFDDVIKILKGTTNEQ